MRKLLFLVVCCFCLCGCGNKFQTSEFNWKKSGDLYPLYFANGSIKNNSSKNCKTLYIDLVYKNGNLEEKDLCSYYDGINSGETINIECQYSGDIKNIEDYKIEIKDIECFN